MKKSFGIVIIGLLLIGCSNKEAPLVVPQIIETDINNTLETLDLNETEVVKQTMPKPPPRKKIKLKKVKDNNFDEKYMYPTKKNKPKKIISPKPIIKTDSMTKEECISMIGEDKFAKYSKMFKSESASIKRCVLLKAMKSRK